MQLLARYDCTTLCDGWWGESNGHEYWIISNINTGEQFVQDKEIYSPKTLQNPTEFLCVILVSLCHILRVELDTLFVLVCPGGFQETLNKDFNWSLILGHNFFKMFF